jgi:septal ring factor EnvC (AmiA/AmiB activator)
MIISFNALPRLLLSLFVTTVLVLPVKADDLTANQQRLEEISEQLKALQEELAKNRQAESEQQKALTDVERQLTQTRQTRRGLLNQIQENNAQLDELNRQQQVISERLDDMSGEIKSILRLAYKQNNQPLIKLLLSGSRPEDLSRHLYYFSELTKNQQTQVQQWVNDQNQLALTISAKEQTIVELDEQQRALSDEENKLGSQINRRAQIIANLKAETNSTAREIARQEEEQQRTKELISELEAELANMNLDFFGSVPVASVKGKLPWPVEGKLTNRYGRTIDGSRLQWQGWLIAANDGEPVSAIHGGRIVFADFFKSHGLLIIIDHGDGIWTLYGRNQSLLRAVGSWVEGGDVIAEVGRSGGYNESGLYFEVRSDGEPQNPANWLRRQ